MSTVPAGFIQFTRAIYKFVPHKGGVVTAHGAVNIRMCAADVCIYRERWHATPVRGGQGDR